MWAYLRQQPPGTIQPSKHCHAAASPPVGTPSVVAAAISASLYPNAGPPMTLRMLRMCIYSCISFVWFNGSLRGFDPEAIISILRMTTRSPKKMEVLQIVYDL